VTDDESESESLRYLLASDLYFPLDVRNRFLASLQAALEPWNMHSKGTKPEAIAKIIGSRVSSKHWDATLNTSTYDHCLIPLTNFLVGPKIVFGDYSAEEQVKGGQFSYMILGSRTWSLVDSKLLIEPIKKTYTKSQYLKCKHVTCKLLLRGGLTFLVLLCSRRYFLAISTALSEFTNFLTYGELMGTSSSSEESSNDRLIALRLLRFFRLKTKAQTNRKSVSS